VPNGFGDRITSRIHCARNAPGRGVVRNWNNGACRSSRAEGRDGKIYQQSVRRRMTHDDALRKGGTAQRKHRGRGTAPGTRCCTTVYGAGGVAPFAFGISFIEYFGHRPDSWDGRSARCRRREIFALKLGTYGFPITSFSGGADHHDFWQPAATGAPTYPVHQRNICTRRPDGNHGCWRAVALQTWNSWPIQPDGIYSRAGLA